MARGGHQHHGWHECWYTPHMQPERKITLNVPEELLEAAQRTTGQGVTETVRQGLRLVAAGETFRRLSKLRGSVKFTVDLARLRDDRG